MNMRQRTAALLRLKISAGFLNPRPGSLRIRPTSAGLGFFLMVLCGFLLSVNFSNNLIFAMTFLLVAIALVSWYHTWLNLKGLVVSDWRTAPVFAGQPLLFTAKVENPGKRFRHGLQARAGKLGTSGEIHLGGDCKAELQLSLARRPRGLSPAAGVFITSCFPLGLFEGRLRTGDLPRCLVYPQPLGNQPLPENMAGKQAHQNRESTTYTDMRRYSPGDPPSRISWRAFARFDQLYTKEFDGAAGLPALWLSWDSAYGKGMEEKVSQLCRWVVDARKQNREYGLQLPGLLVEPAGDERHYRRCLEILATYGMTEVRA